MPQDVEIVSENNRLSNCEVGPSTSLLFFRCVLSFYKSFCWNLGRLMGRVHDDREGSPS